MRQSRFRLVALIGLLIVGLGASRTACAWGGEGHSYSAALAVGDMPPGPLKTLYQQNVDWFSLASSWPDRWRNRPDAAEAPRHFLDGENFGMGTDLTKLPRDFGKVEKIRTYQQLRTDGIVPWSVGRHYKLLVIAFRESRWDDAMAQSAYLSHYVADSHVPFHASANYDGQLSSPPQRGIHSRFETQTLQRSIKLSDLHTGTPTPVSDPIALTIATCQSGLNQVPTILDADRKALTVSGGTTNDAYWNTFIPLVRPIAISRLELAGRDLSGIILAAWNEAGRPTPPANFLMTDRLMPYAAAFVPRGETAPPIMPVISDEVKDAARARVKPIKVSSAILGRDVDVNIVLPADYDANALRYSVLYLLHGSSGSEKDWATKSGIAAYAEGRGLIVVMPDGGNSWYVNSPGGGKYEDFFVQELIPAIDKSFRTQNRREGRAIAGNSMGGYGAWRLALDNDKLFCAAVSLSGALDMGVTPLPDGEPKEWVTSLYGNADEAALKQYAGDSLYGRIDKHVRRGQWRGPALYFDAGGDDYLLVGDQHMEQYLMERTLPYEYAEFKGGHDWAYWDEHIRDALQFVGRHIAPPSAK